MRKLLKNSLIGFIASALIVVPLTSTASAATTAEQGQIMFVLDASSSMLIKDGGSTTRLDRAKSALSQTLDTLPTTVSAGLRVYGSTIPDTNEVEGCQDTQLISSPKASNAAAIKAALGGVQAKGWTLMGKALEKTQSDFTGTGPKTIILISDGVDTCNSPSACEVAKQLSVSDTKVKINTLGLLVDSAAQSQLECVAKEGRGSYYGIKDIDSLTSSLKSITKKEVELFTAAGIPVHGSLRIEESPLLGNGQRYTDSLTIPQELYYSYELGRGEKLTVTVKAVGTGLNLSQTDYLRMFFYDYSSESKLTIKGTTGSSGRFSGKTTGANVASTSYTFDADKMDINSKTRFTIGVSIPHADDKSGTEVPLEITSTLESASTPATATAHTDGNKTSSQLSPLWIVLLTLAGVIAIAALSFGVWLITKKRKVATDPTLLSSRDPLGNDDSQTS